MPFFSFKPRRPEQGLLATPPPRRLSTSAGDRLATIMESDQPPVPQRSPNARHSAYYSSHSGLSGRSGTATLPRVSSEPMPPPYTAQEVRPEDARYLTEKDANRSRFRRGRGGWGRFALIAAILLIVLAIALGVGLGVGLRKKSSSAGSDSSTSTSDTIIQQFPLGQYSYRTALRNVSTGCTSNSATWRCWPYETFVNSNSTVGEAYFPWQLKNTSATYPYDSSTKTDAAGIPANILADSGTNPFGVIVKDAPLTFINDNDNPRYSFSVNHTKTVIPSAALTSNNIYTECYFNQTVMRAVLYLSNSLATDYGGGNNISSGQSWQAWPYAVDISETAAGGQNVPNCYQTVNDVSTRVNGLTVQPSGQQCSCDYRNFS